METSFEELNHFTRATFPWINGRDPSFDLIVKGGSDRHYYRMAVPEPVAGEPSTAILMCYTPNRPDNLRFHTATATLHRLGVSVPRIYRHDMEKRLMMLEDLGRNDLWSFRQQPWELRKRLYENALREAAQLHKHSIHSLMEEEGWDMEPPFDDALYFWEQDYFVEHFARHFTSLTSAQCNALLHGSFFAGLRAELAALPRCLVHRDFQSQNLMVRPDHRVAMIDYQGLRQGLGCYDVASLLYDPYVALAPYERDTLLQFYHIEMEVTDKPAFERCFALSAAQRLMQALGAYGNLGRNRQKPEFFAHIPAAVTNLRQVIAREPSLAPLEEVLDAMN